MPILSKDKFWDLYKDVPQDIKDLLFSEETGNIIEEICQEHKCPERFDSLLDCVSQALLGLIHPGELEETLINDLKFDKTQAKKLSQKINRLIFFPVKQSISLLNQEESKTIPQKEKPASTGEDKYREAIE